MRSSHLAARLEDARVALRLAEYLRRLEQRREDLARDRSDDGPGEPADFAAYWQAQEDLLTASDLVTKCVDRLVKLEARAQARPQFTPLFDAGDPTTELGGSPLSRLPNPTRKGRPS